MKGIINRNQMSQISDVDNKYMEDVSLLENTSQSLAPWVMGGWLVYHTGNHHWWTRT